MTDLTAIVLKNVLTLEEAAAYIGKSEETVRGYCRDRKFAHSKPNGKDIYIERAELERFLLSGRVAAETELEERADGILLTMKKERDEYAKNRIATH